jgi:CheY-like chemotaxis protein
MLKTVGEMLTPHFNLVAAVDNGKAALGVAAQTNPDLVQLDIMMPWLNGIQTASELRRRGSRPEIGLKRRVGAEARAEDQQLHRGPENHQRTIELPGFLLGPSRVDR